ncbi:DUF192 domain-containing protein [Rhodophyticola porphyridii]|uniref:DUF192 domain-containing protein n=1 Tax=Rhodophyticola porphyridii TaxID=1852017 RepID=A0A3L9Y8L8_9RHOB|nr:DUF192 domain-containing protein [Rhodophyticola porphyridii]RMA42416.1 DUF192 domain-containing protein [Rhodophyticola porphyridii]
MRIFAALLTLVLSAATALAECRPDRVDLRGDFGAASFRVDVADDPQERAVGLMHRPSMPSGAGMIFIYERPQRVSFWMENTLIPLDMIFMDQTGTVTRVHENAIPLDRTPIPGGPDVLAVLEINGGLSSRIGIREGAELRHPGLPQELAAWPCATE